jgi:hypothetical protein
LNLHWYVLGASDTRYRPLEVQVTSGVDLALPLHKIWTTIETFAGPLERLCVQQASVSLQVMNGECEPGLLVRLKLADEDSGLHVVLRKPDAACYLQRGQALHSVAMASEPLDRGIYLLLADLAKSYSTD